MVDNHGNATLPVDDGTTVQKDGDSLKLYAGGLSKNTSINSPGGCASGY